MTSLSKLWHKSLSHINYKALPHVSKVVIGLPDLNIDHEGICKGYAKVKNIKNPFSKSKTNTKKWCCGKKEKRTKLDPSGRKGIFVGYCEFSKAFRIYISGCHHIDISRDVTFDEETILKKSRRCHLEEVHEEDVPPRMVEVEPSPEIIASKDHDMLEP